MSGIRVSMYRSRISKWSESVLEWLCMKANSSAAAHWKKCTFPVWPVCLKTGNFSLFLPFCLIPELSLQFIHAESAILFLKIPVISPSQSTPKKHLFTLFWTSPRGSQHALCRTNAISNTKEKQCKAVLLSSRQGLCGYENGVHFFCTVNLKVWKIWTV